MGIRKEGESPVVKAKTVASVRGFGDFFFT